MVEKLYTVSDVLEKLKNARITQSGQMVRRYLRSGKLKGYRNGRGWLVHEADLQHFIGIRNGSINPVTKEDCDQAYQFGYEEGQKNLIKKLLLQGMCETVRLRKSVVRYHVDHLVHKQELRTRILDWIFEKKQSITLHKLEGYVWLYDGHELVPYQNEDQIAEIITDLARKKVIDDQKRVHPWIG